MNIESNENGHALANKSQTYIRKHTKKGVLQERPLNINNTVFSTQKKITLPSLPSFEDKDIQDQNTHIQKNYLSHILQNDLSNANSTWK